MAFWGGPVLGFLLGNRGNILAFPLVGAMTSGFALAKVRSKTIVGVIFSGVVYSIGVLLVYVGIIFVGCLVI